MNCLVASIFQRAWNIEQKKLGILSFQVKKNTSEHRARFQTQGRQMLGINPSESVEQDGKIKILDELLTPIWIIFYSYQR